MEKRLTSEDFIVVFRKGKDLKIVISKKVAKLAVDRNRIKRLIREALRDKRKELIVIVRKNIKNLKMRQVQQKLQKLLEC